MHNSLKENRNISYLIFKKLFTDIFIWSSAGNEFLNNVKALLFGSVFLFLSFQLYTLHSRF